MTTTTKRSRHTDRKAVLFCQVCEYEAPTDGEWVVREHDQVDGRHTVIECPICEHVVLDQPTFGLVA